jgi:xanthine/CO dehydrogenase XdhC/CoxF family maturation factor
MMELRHILERTEADADGDAILATLVDVKGSGYRLAGARMLIDGDGKSIGTVSGGCLEADVLERAKEVRRSGKPAVISYDTTKDDSSVFGLGMGCPGVVRVLLESTRNNDALDFIRTCFDRRKKGAITTLISKSGDVGLELGSRMFLENAVGSYRKGFAELSGSSAAQRTRVRITDVKSG